MKLKYQTKGKFIFYQLSLSFYNVRIIKLRSQTFIGRPIFHQDLNTDDKSNYQNRKIILRKTLKEFSYDWKNYLKS
jgi:hypothetical protein